MNVLYSFITFSLVFVGVKCTAKQIHTVKKSFYSNGHLKSEISFLNGKVKDGEAIYYDIQGSIIKREYYKNDKNDSAIIIYYPNGTVEKNISFFQSYPISYYEYYTNKNIKRYSASDFVHQLFYQINYDSLSGEKKSEKGLAISKNYGVKHGFKKKYRTGDSLILIFLIPQPPNYDSRALVGIYKINELSDTAVFCKTVNKETIEPFKEYNVQHSAVPYYRIFSEKGVYQVICIGEIIDRATSYKKSDTIANIWKIE